MLVTADASVVSSPDEAISTWPSAAAATTVAISTPTRRTTRTFS